jgi:hypothetical protein
MREMIFGPPASGTSSFAIELGKIRGLDPFHTDEVSLKVGRDRLGVVKSEILSRAAAETWIIEGTAFRADPEHRFACADVIYAFDIAPIFSYLSHIKRGIKQRFGEPQIGGGPTTVRPVEMAKYIFTEYPRRHEHAMQKALAAREQGAELLVFNSTRQAFSYLESIRCNM